MPTPVAYPDYEGFALTFSRGEIDLAGRIFRAIEGVSGSQPVEEGEVMGAASQVLARTDGQQKLGKGQLDWASAEDHDDFIEHLSKQPGPAGWSRKIFNVTAVYATPDGSRIRKVEYLGCRALDSNEANKQGTDAIKPTMPFSFLRRRINGREQM